MHCNMEMKKQLEILLVEDDPGDALLMQAYLEEKAGKPFRLIRVDRLAPALDLIASEAFDAVLLDLGLPDSHASKALNKYTPPCRKFRLSF